MNELNDELYNELTNSSYNYDEINKIVELFINNKSDNHDYNLISSATVEIPKFKIEFINNSKNENPKYMIEGSSGFDIRANLTETIMINIGEYCIIPTGLHFNIPNGFEIQIRSRSGLASKYGVCVLNSPGTIDSGYIGEVKIILINHGKEVFKVENGDRIAQGVIATVLNDKTINLVNVDEFNVNSERGDSGFGSTGFK